MFKISQQGLDKIVVRVNGVSDRSMDLSPALKRGRLVMLASVGNNFRRSGRPSPWAPLRSSTLKQKARLRYSSRPLIRTGHLQKSITGDVTKNSLRIGTSVPYAKFHQYGTKKMIARPFLVFQKQDISDINELVKRYILKGDV